MRKRHAGAAIVATLMVAAAAHAFPSHLTHEGLLLDEDGLPLNGRVVLHLRLWDAPAGGDQVWAEQHTVDLVAGYYTVWLGEQEPLDEVFGDAPVYLGISVDGAPELSPRHPMGSVPSAFVADNVVGDITPRSITVGGQVLVTPEGDWEGLLEIIRARDGSGSGLDADRIDGVDSAVFLRADRDTGTLGNLTVGGSLGVGVDEPEAEVDVAGTVRADAIEVGALQFSPLTAPPEDPAAGTMYYDEEQGLRFWDGTSWLGLQRGGSGGGGGGGGGGDGGGGGGGGFEGEGEQELGGDGSDGALVVAGVNTEVNEYAAIVRTVLSGANALEVDDASGLSAGDEILIVQMQGPGESAGRHEFRFIAAIDGTWITVNQPMSFDYLSGVFDQGNGRAAQVVRVPNHTNVTINGGSITAPAWDGRTGGIVALRASERMDFRNGGTVDVDGRGFRGPPRENVRHRNGRVGEGVRGNSRTICANQNTLPDTGTGGCGAIEGAQHSNDGVASAGGGANEALPPGDGTPYGGRYRAKDGLPHVPGDFDLLVPGGAGGQGDVGSNDWSAAAKGGNGGGVVFLASPAITGPIVWARGQDGEVGCDHYGSGGDWGVSGGGGGAGGTIWVSSTNISGAQLVATGGAGGGICNHGGYVSSSGGAGRIRVDSLSFTGGSNPAGYRTAPAVGGQLVVEAEDVVVNRYSELTGNALSGTTVLSVRSGAGFKVDDEVLLLQMQGPAESAGTWELRTLTRVAGNQLTVDAPVEHDFLSGVFDQGSARAAQVVRVPEFTEVAIVGGSLTAPAWNGRAGGVLALRASEEISFRLGGYIDLDGKGFRGPPRENVRHRNGRVGEGVLGNSRTVCANQNTTPDTLTGGCGAIEGAQHSNDGVAAAGGGANEAIPPNDGHAYSGRYKAKDGRIYRPGDFRVLVPGGAGGGGDVGSNDWAAASKGGSGGGIVFLLAPIVRDPVIHVRGEGGEIGCDHYGSGGDWGVSGGGGGAGGTIHIEADSVLGGTLRATGGEGAGICNHGGAARSNNGGAGRVLVLADDWSGDSEPVAASPAGADAEACGGDPRRVGEADFEGVRMFDFEEVAGPGCTTRTGSCPEGVLVQGHFRGEGFVYADATKNVYSGYARSPGFSLCNGPHSGWGDQPSEFRIVLPGTDLPAVVPRLGFYTAGRGSCNPMRVRFFDVDGNVIGDFDDVPCGTGREPSRWHGFFGMGNIHRVRISGDGYSYDDLRLPVPVAPGDPRACQ